MARAVKWLLVLITGSLVSVIDLRAEVLAIFKGQVLAENGTPLIGANVVLKENYLGSATNENGNFLIKTKAGEYTVEITYIGYAKIQERIRLQPGQTLQRTFTMKIQYFEIGGIVVMAEKELLPNTPETSTKIRAGEIEHLQASSLSDVLKLVPGQKFDNPGLQSLKQAAVRISSTEDIADRNATFGTQVVLDNVPLSNNANMQLDTRINTGGVQRTTENAGIDLRQIPADNIAEVEVVRGVPSAKYGDLTAGIIRVTTRNDNLQQRFKYKYNLQNQEFNLSGGFGVLKQIISYNCNYAYSQRDIRIPDYGYARLAAQISHSAKIFKNLYTVDNRLYFTRTFDEQGLRPGDLLLSESYNRDYIIRYNHTSKIIPSPTQKLEFNYAFNLNRQNSYSKRLLTSDRTYLTDRLTTGTQYGYFFSTDTTRLWVKGRAINHYFNLEYNRTFNWLNLQHNWLSGINYRLEQNNGPGRIFDPLRPPSITSIFRDRPRSYDDLPDLHISSFFIEDKVIGKLLTDFQLNIGVRYERYGTGSQLFAHQRGAFVNPRFNLALFPREETQVRLGYGVTSKAPALSMLFPNPIYFDLDDVNYYTGDTTGYVIVSTYVYRRANPKLKGYQQFKREVSFDQQVGKMGFSITAYSTNTPGAFASSELRPIFLYRYDYPHWPDTSGRVIRDSVYTYYTIYANSLQINSRGIEFSIQTKPVTALQLRFRLEGAYNQTHSHQQNYEYAATYLYDSQLGKKVLPFWNVIDVKAENLILNYRLEFAIKQFGAWITCEAQQIVFDKDWYRGLNDSLAVGYVDNQGQIYYFDPAQRAALTSNVYKRTYPAYWSKVEHQKNIWLFNLRVSKALVRGTEISFFVNNIFNSHPLYRRARTAADTQSYIRLNPDLFFGIEISGILEKLWQ